MFALAGGCANPTAPSTFIPAPSSAPVAPSAARSSAPSASASIAGSPSPSPSGAPSPTAQASLAHPDLAVVRTALQPIATGLTAPLYATGAHDGSGRLFVLEQAGTVRLIRNGSLAPDPFLDLKDRVASGGERGLLGLAFAPGFGPAEPRLYVHYSNHDGDTTIAELRATPGADRVDPATERIVLVQQQPYANHNGGWIGFDAQGRLLIGLGDGGSGGDPENRASNLATMLGKILRIDVLAGPADGRAYAIPPDNPFVTTAGARPEILDFGLRNPYRDSIDPVTGTLWIGDVGQNAWEEVDAAPAGAAGLDFGWRRWEGRHCYNPPTGCDAAGVTMPLTEYGHDQGCAIVGGVVYRGAAIPALDGAYLFGDYCSGKLWAIDAGGGGGQTPVLLLSSGLAIGSMTADDTGEVVVTDLRGGAVLRLVAAPG
jgi:glucose/arabinose dehydrogenase